MTSAGPTSTAVESLFAPLALGPLTARSRVMMPPHTSAIGNLWGTEDDAEKNLAYMRLRAAVHRSVAILVAHLPAVTLLLRVRGNSEVELAALKRRRALDDKLAGLVAAAVEEGSVRADIPADLISRLLFGMVNSLVEWYRPGGPVDADVLATSIAALAFDGLALHLSLIHI